MLVPMCVCGEEGAWFTDGWMSTRAWVDCQVEGVVEYGVVGRRGILGIFMSLGQWVAERLNSIWRRWRVTDVSRVRVLDT